MDVERFIDQSRCEDFVCPICLLIVQDPIVEHVDCCTTFCRSCFDALPTKSNCPVCMKSTTGRMSGMHPKVRSKLYSTLDVRCSIDGCQDIVTLGALQQHEAQCGYRMIPCQFCNKKIRANGTTDHYQHECPMTLVTCIIPGCGILVPRGQMDAHLYDNMIQHNTLMIKRIEVLESICQQHDLDVNEIENSM